MCLWNTMPHTVATSSTSMALIFGLNIIFAYSYPALLGIYLHQTWNMKPFEFKGKEKVKVYKKIKDLTSVTLHAWNFRNHISHPEVPNMMSVWVTVPDLQSVLTCNSLTYVILAFDVTFIWFAYSCQASVDVHVYAYQIWSLCEKHFMR